MPDPGLRPIERPTARIWGRRTFRSAAVALRARAWRGTDESTARDSSLCLQPTLFSRRRQPWFHEPAVNLEQIQAAAYRLIDDVGDALRPVIERRHRRHDDGAVLGRGQHAPQVPVMQRSLADDQN